MRRQRLRRRSYYRWRKRRLRRLLAQHGMFLRHGRCWRLGPRFGRLTGYRHRGRRRRIERVLYGIRRRARTLGILTVSAGWRLVHGHERAFAAENAVTVMLLPTIRHARKV